MAHLTYTTIQPRDRPSGTRYYEDEEDTEREESAGDGARSRREPRCGLVAAEEAVEAEKAEGDGQPPPRGEAGGTRVARERVEE